MKSSKMTYEIYETKAFVLSAHNTGEGNRLFYLLTEDLGLVKAVAQNIRAEKSKLRYNLQANSSLEVSLVRGREYWRIIGAKNGKHFFYLFKNDLEKLHLLNRLFSLLSRMIQGEGGNNYLFGTMEGAVKSLEDNLVSESYVRCVEILAVSRILWSLGYFSEPARYRIFFSDTSFDSKILNSVVPIEKSFLADINTAIHESHL